VKVGWRNKARVQKFRGEIFENLSLQRLIRGTDITINSQETGCGDEYTGFTYPRIEASASYVISFVRS
jgi:hypothetical protein